MFFFSKFSYADSDSDYIGIQYVLELMYDVIKSTWKGFIYFLFYFPESFECSGHLKYWPKENITKT